MQDHKDELRFPGCEYQGNATAFIERVDVIRDHTPLLDGFDRGDVVGVLRKMRCYCAAPGQEIIREGDPGTFMLLLLEGNIEITKAGRMGRIYRINIVVPGETIGEMSLIDGEPRFANCLSIDEALFAVLDRDGLHQILEDEPSLGIKILGNFLKHLNQRLRDTGQHLVDALDR